MSEGAAGAVGPRRYLGSLIRRTEQLHEALWLRDVSRRVSSVQYGTLELLELLPGASQKDLCDGLSLDRSTVADVVRRMERADLLRRDRDPDDLRRNVLDLTAHGRTQLEALRPRVEELQETLARTLSEPETAELKRLLNRVLAGADALTDAAAEPR